MAISSSFLKVTLAVIFLFQILVIGFLVPTAVAATTDDKSSNSTCTATTTTKEKMKLCDLWAQGSKASTQFLAGVYEHSPWVAETLLKDATTTTSIKTVSALHQAMKSIVDEALPAQKMELLLAHPDLAQKVEALSELTKESQDEQSSAGLQSLTPDELAKFTTLNTQYKQKFQFPFILAVRHATKYTVLAALEGRLPHTPQAELVTALEQVHKIAWMRILAQLESDEPAGFLTCHVLDTAHGCPGTYYCGEYM